MIRRKDEIASKKKYEILMDTLKVSYEKEINKLQKDMLEFEKEAQKQMFLGNQQEAQQARTSRDNCRARITYLNGKKQSDITNAYEDVVKFNRPHVNFLQARLSRLSQGVELQKDRKRKAVNDTQFFGRILTVETNLKSCIEYQIKISQVFEELSKHEARPLADFVKMVEDVEKAQPSQFSTIEIRLHEREMGELDQFFIPAEDLDNPDFKVNIVPSIILKERIKALEFFTKKDRRMAA